MKRPLIVISLLLAGCGASDDRSDRPPPGPPPKPQLFGKGPQYFPKPRGARVRNAEPISGMRCTRRSAPRYLAHLEIFLNARVVLIPKGIGVSPKHRCSYPLRTREPTGVIEVAGAGTLGDLFAIWGRPLPRGARAYVGRKHFEGDPRTIRIDPHSVITVETGRFVAPHVPYVFP